MVWCPGPIVDHIKISILISSDLYFLWKILISLFIIKIFLFHLLVYLVNFLYQFSKFSIC